jgi:hypothetical protein
MFTDDCSEVVSMSAYDFWLSVAVNVAVLAGMFVGGMLASMRSKLVFVACLFIMLSAGVMIWMMTDLARDPSYGPLPSSAMDWISWAIFTIPSYAALGAMVYSLLMESYRYLLLSAALSSVSILFPIGIVASIIVWWDHKKYGL